MKAPIKIGRITIAISLSLLVGTACVGVGVDEYIEFRSAVDSGASCAQLIDIADNFDDRPAVRDRIDDDLRAIGCAIDGSERTDQ